MLNPSSSEDIKHLQGNESVSFLPMDEFKEDGQFNALSSKPLSEIGSGYSFFQNGDVAFAKVTPCFENGKGAVLRNLINGVGFGSTELIVARPRIAKITSNFLYYLFFSSEFRHLGKGSMHGTGGLKRVPDDFVKNYQLHLPPVSEQTEISEFLDRQTNKIDQIIQKQERLIELLVEKRQAVISQAVTKGLDPTVPMKDSGITWIGWISRGWNIIPLRLVARLESGHTPSRQHPEFWANCTIPWFTLADVWQLREGRTYVNETSECVSELGLANSSARLLPSGTVILSRTASVGFSGILGCEMATTQDFANWICGPRLRPKFLHYLFLAMRSEFNKLKYGSTHSTIYMPDINAFRIPLPPIEEQEDVVSYLDEQISKIDRTVFKSKASIVLLKERRSALISAAVTGKIDVREVA
jgi:type I restriction enzyme S subunit